MRACWTASDGTPFEAGVKRVKTTNSSASSVKNGLTNIKFYALITVME
eukprot:SAG31_NODE_4760_length_2973_cov_3.074113_2_plen_48_part_00